MLYVREQAAYLPAFAVIAGAREKASEQFPEFFAAVIRNENPYRGLAQAA